MTEIFYDAGADSGRLEGRAGVGIVFLVVAVIAVISARAWTGLPASTVGPEDVSRNKRDHI